MPDSLPLDHLAVSQASGADTARFLHNQLSADIEALGISESTFACYCNPKGQVWALLYVTRLEDDSFQLICREDLQLSLLQRLRLFVLRDKVSLEPRPELQVCGDPELLDPNDKSLLEPGSCAYRVESKGSAADPAESSAWKAMELQQGIWWLNQQSSQQFIPQMLGFDHLGAVNFSKGCYPGQEIVARARYLGNVKRGPLLCHLTQPLPSPWEDGLKIRRGESWQSARLVEQHETLDGGALLALVASNDPQNPVEEVELVGQRYGCATM